MQFSISIDIMSLVLYVSTMDLVLYSMQDFAERAGISYASIRNYHSQGILPESGGYVANSPFWTHGDVEEWIANRRPAHRPRRDEPKDPARQKGDRRGYAPSTF